MADRAEGVAAVTPWMAAKSTWRRWLQERAAAGAAPDLRIGLASTFTDNGLVQFVGAHLLQEGFRPDIALGPYNQLFQVCLDPRAHFGDACDVVALLWRIEDLLADEIAAVLGGETGSLAGANDQPAALVAALAKLRAGFGGMIVVALPPYPTGLCTGPLALDNPVGLGALHRALVGQFTDAVAAIEGVRLLDLDAVQRTVGLTA